MIVQDAESQVPMSTSRLIYDVTLLKLEQGSWNKTTIKKQYYDLKG